MTATRTCRLIGFTCALALLPGCQEKPTPVRIDAATVSPPDAATPQPARSTAAPAATRSAADAAAAPVSPSATAQLPPQAGKDAKTATQKQINAPRFSAKSTLYDRQGPAYGLLQSAADALGRFPADSLGNIDWVQALQAKMIAPRATLSGKGTMQLRNDDIIMRETREMPWVRFPHRQHTEWLDCKNCHPRPFIEKAGTNQITMDTIMRGEHCGMCHDRVAFSIFACERCHSVTHPGSPKPWW